MKLAVMITVRDLVKEYKIKRREVYALNGVSLEIGRGERVAVMGMSGSGKSTLMHLIGGLDKPTSGSILINNHNLEKMKDKELSAFRNQQVGFIFQDFNLISYLTVGENTMLPLWILGTASSQAEAKAEALLEQLGLADLAGRYPHQLSGGQKQRVAVARALITQPSIILADEPTANLDDKNAKIVLDLIRQIELGEDRAMMIVTHNHDIAKQFDRVIYLSDGKISRKSNFLV